MNSTLQSSSTQYFTKIINVKPNVKQRNSVSKPVMKKPKKQKHLKKEVTNNFATAFNELSSKLQMVFKSFGFKYRK